MFLIYFGGGYDEDGAVSGGKCVEGEDGLAQIPLEYESVSAHIDAPDAIALGEVQELLLLALPDHLLAGDSSFQADHIFNFPDVVLLVAEVGEGGVGGALELLQKDYFPLLSDN